MKNIDSYNHTRGESVYVDDVPTIEGTLYAKIVTSPVSHGKIEEIDPTDALKMDGIKAVFTAADIPGYNQIGRLVQDELLLADQEVHFMGHPIALVVGESNKISELGVKAVKVKIEEKQGVYDPKTAYHLGHIIGSPRTFEMGDVDKNWSNCDLIIEDEVKISGQEHVYIETQGAYAKPIENNALKIISSTQGPTAVQQMTAQILDIPMHKVEVDVRRLGGAFGGKEDQATAYASMAGLAAFLLKKPVKLILEREVDIKITGKRHPYVVDYKMGLNKEGKIIAFEANYYQNAGAAADLSPAVLERTLFHATNSYFVPHVRISAFSCKTNIPPNTAFRGFGGPQGMVVIEAALDKAANLLEKNTWDLQKLNLIGKGDHFPYGQSADDIYLDRVWEKTEDLYDLEKINTSVQQFNAKNNVKKKGFAVMPVCFGISFTATFMNQASALVNVYNDGSVGVSTAAVEMGQGVNTRISQVPQRVFSLGPERIKMETTNTTRNANTSPSAASSTHDLNGMATKKACTAILDRLKSLAASELDVDSSMIELKDEVVHVNDKPTDMTWEKLVKAAFFNRVDLSQRAFYATPNIFFDKDEEKGKPFAYHAFGVGIVETTVDCIRGTYEIDSVKVVHDFGKSMNKIIDLGQMEGGIVQGIGWMTSEELRYDNTGRLESGSLSTYKIPDIYAAPKDIEVHFLEDTENPYGLFKSKAIGEPPLMYGIGAYFSIRNAIRAFNPNLSEPVHTPITPERVLFGLYGRESLRKLLDEKSEQKHIINAD